MDHINIPLKSMSMVFVEQPLALSGSANNIYLKGTHSKAFIFGLYIVLKLNLFVYSFRLKACPELKKNGAKVFSTLRLTALH